MSTGSAIPDEKRDEIEAWIRLGGWDYVAAEAVGIDRRTFWRELEADPDFRARIEKAKAETRAEAIRRVEERRKHAE